MKKLLIKNNGGHLAIKSSLILLLGVTLGLAFWTATTPGAKARDMSPAEMIQAELPAGQTVASAAKPDLLKAVCGAVRKHPAHAPQIVRVAASAHKPWTVEIAQQAMQCLSKNDCRSLRGVVAAAGEESPEDVAALHDYFVQFAPSCVGGQTTSDSKSYDNKGVPPPIVEEETFVAPPVNINPPPGSVGAGAGQTLCCVCHNGHEIRIPCRDVDKFLQRHPGDTFCPCRPTPVTNQ
ncbi:MAG: hypothetical protein ABJB09_01915 [Verrucomicrobiota bacterium]